MSPVRAHEAEFDRVLDAIYLGVATQAREANTVIHFLCAVLVTDVEHDTVFAAVKEESMSIARHISTRSGNPRVWGTEGDLLRGHVADEEFGTPAPPPARSGVDLGYRAHAVGVASNGTDCGNRAVYVVDPDLALLDELAGLDARTVEG